ncbi:MAG: histidine kinase, partial [Proteobacteria bacterium]|nr:histidine kinase [Pseudomonadota bacterium]
AELKKTQAQILQSEKMASTGQLAVGAADEISNSTDIVNSNLKSLNKYRKDMESFLKVYEETEKSLPPEALKKIKKVKQEIDFDSLLRDFGPLIDESMEVTERIKKITANLKE